MAMTPGGSGITLRANGSTRSSANGQSDPNARDANVEREEAAGRLHEMLGEATSAERLHSGNVAPRWREAERLAQHDFHPSAATVSEEGVVGGFFHSWLNSRPDSAGAQARGADDARPSAFNGYGGAGAGARMKRGEGGRTRAIVEVVVAADGSIASARLVSRSGRRKFDEEALATVQLAVGSHPGPLEEGTTVVTRWAVEAWVDVAAPNVGGGFTFDESTGKVSGDYPMKKGVKGEVKLLSIVARR